MRAKIVYDAPGRIRLRGGADAFEKSAEAAIEQYALKNEWVLDCEAHCENGGILLTYKKGCREKALCGSLCPPLSSLYRPADMT